MYNHEPANYSCPFCTLVQGGETKRNKQEHIIYQNKKVLAFVSPLWWINNPGNILVIPKQHVENIYDISDELLCQVYKVVKKTSIAMKHAYKCDGTSTRQHNEPAGDQFVWHFHVHVYPRYTNDKLYQNHDKNSFVEANEMKPYVKKLKKYLKVKKSS